MAFAFNACILSKNIQILEMESISFLTGGNDSLRVKNLERRTEMITVSYYDDYKREFVTRPVSECPDVFFDCQATVEDLRAWHAERRRAYREEMEWIESHDCD